ncbi:hypothetical protein [Pedobacter cryotolerans]|uniref:Uncharacterized protein n=1 Tax=Pedobacter cryotolerans TaxID=2571270 RepID=A0A4U1CBM0_9SPHI|nr:hypothetical protein [Pedobacter cryotolerans]TKC01160.1 hypothetical protein FA045_07895 [Pedobacter cryotolerans]
MEKKYKLDFKQIILILFLLLNINSIKAQTTGYGCLFNSRIYQQYLGEASPYGGAKMRYYKSNGTYVDINYNNYNSSKPNYYGYECNKVNSFPASQVGPEQKEFVSQGKSCIISTSRGGEINGHGDYVYYSYNNPTYCSTSKPVNVPLDSYIWLLILGVGGIGAFLISKKGYLA